MRMHFVSAIVFFSILAFACHSADSSRSLPDSGYQSPVSNHWDFKETLIIEDLHRSAHAVKLSSKEGTVEHAAAAAYDLFVKDLGYATDPAVLVSAKLEGSAFRSLLSADAKHRDVLDMIPPTLSSLFEAFIDEESIKVGLSDFEWSMCGGRYKPNWPVVEDVTRVNSQSPMTESEQLRSAIYKHQNHVMCGLSPVTSCYRRRKQSRPATKSRQVSLGDTAALRSHHARLLRHWGGVVGTTNGIMGSVYDVHDRYGEAPTESEKNVISNSSSGSPLDSVTALLSLKSRFYRSASEFEGSPATSPKEGTAHRGASFVDALLDFDLGELSSGTTSGNRLIAAHKRPQASHTLGLNRSCFHDISTMERLCTENLLPLLFFWEDVLQTRDLPPRRAVKRRLKADEWSLPYDSPNRRSYASQPFQHHPDARLSVLDVVVPDAIFILSTGYHSVHLKLSMIEDEVSQTERLQLTMELAFILSTSEEVQAFQHFVEQQRSRELSELVNANRGPSGPKLLGNALHKSDASLVDQKVLLLLTSHDAETKAEKGIVEQKQADLPMTSITPPRCTVGADTVQFGEVGGELTLAVACTAHHSAHDDAPMSGVVESLLLLPSHTVNPLVSSMRFESEPVGGQSQELCATPFIEVLRVWYDPLSTVTSVVIRTTIPLPSAHLQEGGNSTVRTRAILPFKFPSLRLDHYPPDMNKAYTIPQVVSRVRFSRSGAEEHSRGGTLDVLHQTAISMIMDGVEGELADGGSQSLGWSYQRCRTVSTVTLPLPDPGMVFNVLSLSSAIIALLVGRGVGIVLRRSIL